MLIVKSIPKQNSNMSKDFIETLSSFSDFQVHNALMLLVHFSLPLLAPTQACIPALCALHLSVYQFPQQNSAHLVDIWKWSKTFLSNECYCELLKDKSLAACFDRAFAYSLEP